MKLHVQISDGFGPFCADGEKAAAFRHVRIDPFVQSHDQIILDFSGVRSVNTSFANALVANLISQYPEVLPRLSFLNCNARVRVGVEAAISLGMERLRERENFAVA